MPEIPATTRPSSSRTKTANSSSGPVAAASLAAAATRSSSSASSAGSGESSTTRRYGGATGAGSCALGHLAGGHLLHQGCVVEVVAERRDLPVRELSHARRPDHELATVRLDGGLLVDDERAREQGGHAVLHERLVAEDVGGVDVDVDVRERVLALCDGLGQLGERADEEVRRPAAHVRGEQVRQCFDVADQAGLYRVLQDCTTICCNHEVSFSQS